MKHDGNRKTNDSETERDTHTIFKAKRLRLEALKACFRQQSS
jgi:hypothetical protein